MSTVKFLYSNYNINNTISQLVAVLKEDYSSFYLVKKYDIIKIMKIKITRKKMKNITTELSKQFAESCKLEEDIKNALKSIGYDI